MVGVKKHDPAELGRGTVEGHPFWVGGTRQVSGTGHGHPAELGRGTIRDRLLWVGAPGITSRMGTAKNLLETNARALRICPAEDDQEWLAFCRSASEDGSLEVTCQSAFAGISEVRPFREMRVASAVHPQRWHDLVSRVHEAPIVVCDKNAMLAWMLLGGEALVTREMATISDPEWLEPTEVGRVAGTPGFIRCSSLQKSDLNHAPTKKTRLNVFLRDQRRCRVCGRRPEEDVHCTLHAHHGIPWGGSQSGLTTEENLFTLCSTCHEGIEPGLEHELLASIGVHIMDSIKLEQRTYFQSIKRYRRKIALILAKARD